LIERIRDWPDLGGNDYFRMQGLGEVIYWGAYDILGILPWKESAEATTEFRKLVTAAAEKRWQIMDHTMYPEKFDWMLDMFEDLDKTHDIKPLRWSPHHCYKMTREQMVRARELNMFVAMQTSSTLPGSPVAHFGGPDQPPMRSAQESGVMWGVTGKDAAGNVKNPTETVSREDALIAHTRSNAWFLFQEENLGSIESGKYADIAVLDKDYMSVPADEIREIESVLTLVGGRVAYEAKH
jgi:predicted amidohydrolase YtcJ